MSFNLALWYSSKAKLYRREANRYFKQFRYSECISSAQQCIEFALKAICEFLNENYCEKCRFTHDVSPALERLAVSSPLKNEFSRASLISSRWVGMKQKARMLINYGNQKAKVPATDIVSKKDAEQIKADALEVCNLLNKIEKEKKFGSPIRLGILNGYVEGPYADLQEKRCEDYPWTEFKDTKVWKDRFSEIVADGKSKYEVEEISVSQISNRYAVIINPFGEAYPEKDLKTKLCFNIIKNYIDDGGIFVNVAGFPFFYGWDVMKGERVAISEEKVFIPSSINVELEKLRWRSKKAYCRTIQAYVAFFWEFIVERV